MGMIRRNGWFGLFCASALALVGPACNGGSDGEDDMGSGGSGDGSGGKVGTGGKGSPDGGSSSGGKAATGGKPGSDGGSSSGGSEASGGGTSTGGSATGGNTASGGMGGVSSGGAVSDGGSAGEMGFGGEGGAPPEPWECGGCLKLTVPLATQYSGTDFIAYLGGVDMTDTVITFRIKVVTSGSGGYYQFFGANDADLDYASLYSGWRPLSGATDFIEATWDLGALSDPSTTYDSKDFYKSDVNAFGIQITGGDSANNTLGEVTMYVDSITFSDGSVADYDFASSVSGFQVNNYNSPIADSTATWVP